MFYMNSSLTSSNFQRNIQLELKKFFVHLSRFDPDTAFSKNIRGFHN